MIESTRWGELDVLFVDMPPGTGDIQLTLSQRTRLAGAVVVTTPQDIALIDARRAIEMFQKVSVPIIGMVQNMATHICSNCGHEDPVFGSDGGQTLANEYEAPVLANIPLSRVIRKPVTPECRYPRSTRTVRSRLRIVKQPQLSWRR